MKGGEITMVKHLNNLLQELNKKEFDVDVVIK